MQHQNPDAPDAQPLVRNGIRLTSAEDAARAAFGNAPPPDPRSPRPELRGDLPPEEVERADRDVVEVRLLWGGDPLAVVHVPAGETYVVGPEAADFVAPDSCGMATLRHEPGRVVLEVHREGASCAERTELSSDDTSTLALGMLTMEVARRPEGKPTPRRGAEALGRPAGYFGLTALATAALASAMAFYTPPMGLVEDDGARKDQLYVMQQYLSAAAERELEVETAEAGGEDRAASDTPAAEGAEGSEGQMGDPEEARHEPRRFSTKGSSESPVIQQTRAQTLEAAQNFGLIGILNASMPEGLDAPWADALEGSGDLVAMGALYGKELGPTHGMGGLGLSGPGQGGGGDGRWIAMNLQGTCLGGLCTGTSGGFRRGPARPMREHVAKAPTMRTGVTQVQGTLAATVIQRVVRQNFGRFRNCYEVGLARNPNLEGRVTARFIIGRDGAVASVQSGGVDLPDSGVVSCVLDAYRSLSFPAPEHGIVTVSYPIMFSPAA